MKNIYWLIVFIMLLVFYAGCVKKPKPDGTVKVNCNIGQSLATVVNEVESGTIVSVVGDCKEERSVIIPQNKNNIVIDGNGIRLIGDRSKDAFIIDGHNNTIRNFKISEWKNGIINRGRLNSFKNVFINNVSEFGVIHGRGAFSDDEFKDIIKGISKGRHGSYGDESSSGSDNYSKHGFLSINNIGMPISFIGNAVAAGHCDYTNVPAQGAGFGGYWLNGGTVNICGTNTVSGSSGVGVGLRNGATLNVINGLFRVQNNAIAGLVMRDSSTLDLHSGSATIINGNAGGQRNLCVQNFGGAVTETIIRNGALTPGLPDCNYN